MVPLTGGGYEKFPHLRKSRIAVLFESLQFFLSTPVLYPLQPRENLEGQRRRGVASLRGKYRMTKTIKLTDGAAELMGDGVAVVMQRCDFEGAKDVVLTVPDLKALLAAMED